MLLKFIGILFSALLLGQAAFAQVVSQPSIDESDFTFVKVTALHLPFLKSENYIVFAICNEEPRDCSVLGNGLYALEDIENYTAKNPKAAAWVFQPGVLDSKNVILKDELIQTYIDALEKTLESLELAPSEN